MIKKFEVGKYYIYTHTRPGTGWNEIYMNDVLDHKPRLCTFVPADYDAKYNSYCMLEGVGEHSHKFWAWGNLNYFDEFIAENKFIQEEMEL